MQNRKVALYSATASSLPTPVLHINSALFGQATTKLKSIKTPSETKILFQIISYTAIILIFTYQGNTIIHTRHISLFRVARSLLFNWNSLILSFSWFTVKNILNIWNSYIAANFIFFLQDKHISALWYLFHLN